MVSEEKVAGPMSTPPQKRPLEEERKRVQLPPLPLRFEARLRWLLLLLALPGLVAVVLLLVRLRWPLWASASILAALLLALASIFFAIVERIVRPLQTLSNVVAALREDDYSFRARCVRPADALGDLAVEIHLLADSLQQRHHVELETSALLARVVETMDLPVFAFDVGSVLRLTNPAAVRMLGRAKETLLHQSAEQLGLAALLQQPEEDVVVLQNGDRQTRWMVRRSRFYQGGMPHRLLLLSDVSGVLREEERRAWQRLVRVLTHEVNNSLTPIKSIAGSLRKRASQGLPAECVLARDFERGLLIMEERAGSLNRFLQAYGQLAKLPSPTKQPTPLAALVERVCHLETRISVEMVAGPDITVLVDPAQIEQVLINLLRNAVDAAMEAEQQVPSQQQRPSQQQVLAQHPGTAQHAGPAPSAWVGITWQLEPSYVYLRIEDNGPGLSNSSDLFVPFYTTKPGGSGIGLALARQITELHGGTLSLQNRVRPPGCIAELRLPIGSM
jgi:nitrogen fixation/metabolism regulation signal transduction histidine kinase